MIKPTVGRVVWFWTKKPVDEHQQPQAAIVAHVWGDRCVNLAIFDPNGNAIPHPPTSVRLVQEGDELPAEGQYATWMPYQIGQSKAQQAK